MKKTGTISILHIIFLAMTVIGLKNHVTILPPLLEEVGRDGWASVLFAAGSTLPWLLLLVYVGKKMNGMPIKDWLQDKLGKAGAGFIRYAIAIYLLIVASFTIDETLQWVNATFLPETPYIFMLLIYVTLCVFFATTSLSVIVMANVLVLAVVVVLGFFVAFTNIKVKNYELLQPFFEHGFRPIVEGAIYPASGFFELTLLLLIQHKCKTPLRYKHFVIILVILTILTLGPLIGAITEFGPVEAAKQRYPAYEEWGLVRIGRFIEHVDFLSIYQWLTGAFIRVGFIIYIVIDLLGWENNKKQVWRVIAPGFFFICIPLLELSDHKFLMLKGKFLLTGSFVSFFLMTLFFVVLTFFSRKTSKKDNTQSN
ncbi:endospore germination permease [Sporosarcina sp. Te-1]|uniref:endospore germination permease n=1 Tax=Sporosarcina sp. Te-1 TaxID=2818390 RepID=UPI001A9E501E|nr:endospore germination permease [Sporosarcina sp. Te-1]QTD40479.1 endospore germination permease [Sporosarcina sp. Te-1]